MKKNRVKGSVRGLDQMGRISIPSEIRKEHSWQAGDSLEIINIKEGVLLKTYQPGCSACGEVEASYVSISNIKLCEKCAIIVAGRLNIGKTN